MKMETDFRLIIRNFRVMLPFSVSNWVDVLMTAENLSLENQKTIIKETLASTIFQEYPPSLKYRQMFAKQIIKKCEDNGLEIAEELFEIYSGLISQSPNSERFFKTHMLPNNGMITLEETSNIISGGTTGLMSWPAGHHLVEWAAENTDIFMGKNVLELGCGLGLTGLAVCHMCRPASYIFSDCHENVLETLRRNIDRNLERNNSKVLRNSKNECKTSLRTCSEMKFGKEDETADCSGTKDNSSHTSLDKNCSDSESHHCDKSMDCVEINHEAGDNCILATADSDGRKHCVNKCSDVIRVRVDQNSVDACKVATLDSTDEDHSHFVEGVDFGHVGDWYHITKRENSEKGSPVHHNHHHGTIQNEQTEEFDNSAPHDWSEEDSLLRQADGPLIYSRTKLCMYCIDWESVPEDWLSSLAVDVIVACDVIFDPRLFPSLIRVLVALLHRHGNMSMTRHQPVAILASALRNESTYNLFLESLDTADLDVEVASLPKAHFLSYDRSCPVQVLKLTARSCAK